MAALDVVLDACALLGGAVEPQLTPMPPPLPTPPLLPQETPAWAPVPA
jgi:hypothetical protein